MKILLALLSSMSLGGGFVPVLMNQNSTTPSSQSNKQDDEVNIPVDNVATRDLGEITLRSNSIDLSPGNIFGLEDLEKYQSLNLSSLSISIDGFYFDTEILAMVNHFDAPFQEGKSSYKRIFDSEPIDDFPEIVKVSISQKYELGYDIVSGGKYGIRFTYDIFAWTQVIDNGRPMWIFAEVAAEVGNSLIAIPNN